MLVMAMVMVTVMSMMCEIGSPSDGDGCWVMVMRVKIIEFVWSSRSNFWCKK